ncbi:MAG: hypothetical protein ACYCZM_07235 [Acidimicrobiales bacterium]
MSPEKCLAVATSPQRAAGGLGGKIGYLTASGFGPVTLAKGSPEVGGPSADSHLLGSSCPSKLVCYMEIGGSLAPGSVFASDSYVLEGH